MRYQGSSLWQDLGIKAGKGLLILYHFLASISTFLGSVPTRLVTFSSLACDQLSQGRTGDTRAVLEVSPAAHFGAVGWSEVELCCHSLWIPLFSRVEVDPAVLRLLLLLQVAPATTPSL